VWAEYAARQTAAMTAVHWIVVCIFIGLVVTGFCFSTTNSDAVGVEEEDIIKSKKGNVRLVQNIEGRNLCLGHAAAGYDCNYPPCFNRKRQSVFMLLRCEACDHGKHKTQTVPQLKLCAFG
jgi:hypothetical protein